MAGTNPYLYLVAVLLLWAGLLAGVAAGRRLGRKEGYRTGLARAPLDLRLTALEEGCCPICGSSPEAGCDIIDSPEQVVTSRAKSKSKRNP